MTGRFLVRRTDGRLASLEIGDSARIGLAGERLVIDGDSSAMVHARVTTGEGGRFIEDAGRSNTFVNGEPVNRGPLRHLDVVSIGAALHLVYLEATPFPAAEPPLTEVPPPALLTERTMIGAAYRGLPPNVGVASGGPDLTMFYRRTSADLPPGLLQPEGAGGTINGPLTPSGPLRTIKPGPEPESAPPTLAGQRDAMTIPPPRFLGTVAGAARMPERGQPSLVAAEKAGGERRIVRVRFSGSTGVFEAPLGRCVIGRAGNATIRIDSKKVSRVHAVVSTTPTAVTLEDQQSANGTTVNGTLTAGPRRLLEGDRVSFSDLEFCVSFVRMDGNE